MNQDIIEAINNATAPLKVNFWEKGDVIFFAIIGVGSLIFSILAYFAAKDAKKAATAAGQVVKIQSVIIDLTELTQKINRLSPEIRFNTARDLLTDSSSKIRRIVSSFNHDITLKATIVNLLEALDKAQSALNTVRPVNIDSEQTAPQAVFFGIQEEFSAISNLVAELLGLFESKNIQMVNK